MERVKRDEQSKIAVPEASWRSSHEATASQP